jgi:hypothetical protein
MLEMLEIDAGNLHYGNRRRSIDATAIAPDALQSIELEMK